MRIGVIGINHKLADIRLRELLAQACEKRFSSHHWITTDYHSVLLSTCNRTEVYFCADDLAQTHSDFLNILRQEVNEDFEQKLYSYFGSHCFFHLAHVASGLDSAIVGETEILRQVKTSYEMACRKGPPLAKDLHFLFQKSLKIAKQIRTVLPVGKDLPDITHSLWNIGNHFFSDIRKSRILFIGASEINHKIWTFLKGKGLAHFYLCNRSTEGSRSFAQGGALTLLEWDNLARWHQYDWIIFGTKCPYYLLSQEDLPLHLSARKLIIDLALPRNVDPLLSRHPHITLLNIDQIQRLVKHRTRKMQNTLSSAETLIEAETEKQISLWAKKNSSTQQLRLECI